MLILLVIPRRSRLTHNAYTLDLRMYTAWCIRANIECLGRDMDGAGRAMIARRVPPRWPRQEHRPTHARDKSKTGARAQVHRGKPCSRAVDTEQVPQRAVCTDRGAYVVALATRGRRDHSVGHRGKEQPARDPVGHGGQWSRRPARAVVSSAGAWPDVVVWHDRSRRSRRVMWMP